MAKTILRNVVCFSLMGIGAFVIMRYWFQNPALTEMQVFIDLWPVMFVTVAGPVLALWVDERAQGRMNG